MENNQEKVKKVKVENNTNKKEKKDLSMTKRKNETSEVNGVDPINALKGLSVKSINSKENENNALEEEKKPASEVSDEKTNDHLERMRKQVLAQKRLDKGMIDKEASKAKSKDVLDKLSNLEKTYQLPSEEIDYDELDELNKKIDLLTKENEKLSSDNKEKDVTLEKIKKENEENAKKLDKLSKDLLKQKEESNKTINVLEDEVKKNRILLSDINGRISDENASLKKELSEKEATLKKIAKENKEVKLLKEQNKSLADRVKDMDEKLASVEILNKENKDLKALNNSLKEDLSKKNRELETAKKNDSSKEVNDLKNQLSLKEGKIKELSDDINKLERSRDAEVAGLDEKIGELEDSLKSAKASNEKKDLENEKLRGQNKELQESLENAKATNQNNAIENEKLKNELANKDKELEEKEKQITKGATGDTSKLKEDLKEAKKQIAALQKKDKTQILDDLKKQNSDLKKEVALKAKENEKLNLAKDKISEELKENKKELASVNKKLLTSQKENEKLAQFKKENSNNSKKIDSLTKENAELNNNLEKAQKNFNKKIEEAAQGYTNLLNERLEFEESLAKKCEAVTIEHKDLLAKHEELLKELALKTEEINELNAKLESLELVEANKDEEIELQVDEIDEQEISDLLAEEVSKLTEEEVPESEELEKDDNQEILYSVSLDNEKISALEDEIAECEKAIENIKTKVDNLDESAILDPEFKNKIRSIREMKEELLLNIGIEKKQINNTLASIDEKISLKNREIELANQKVLELEKDYEGGSNRTSVAREEYTAKRSKIMIEIESIRARLSLLNDEKRETKAKYDNLIKGYDNKLDHVSKAEMEIINYYLDKIKADMLDKNDDYRNKEALKEELIRQLNEMKEQTPLLGNKEERIEALNKQITNLKDEYKLLSGKIDIIKEKQAERLESQTNVEMIDEYINMYIHVENDLQGLLSSYRENDETLNKYNQQLNGIKDDSNLRSLSLKFRAKIQDIIIIQSELQSKIESAKRHIQELSKKPRVKYYIDLVASMRELNVKFNQIKSRMEFLNSEIVDKTNELERLSK